ncbi:MAG: hypothetical protein LC729_02330 [Acidobacteria bacterium]|nr:hypothetical protein [Acidobacteriota bacterium]
MHGFGWIGIRVCQRLGGGGDRGDSSPSDPRAAEGIPGRAACEAPLVALELQRLLGVP